MTDKKQAPNEDSRHYELRSNAMDKYYVTTNATVNIDSTMDFLDETVPKTELEYFTEVKSVYQESILSLSSTASSRRKRALEAQLEMKKKLADLQARKDDEIAALEAHQASLRTEQLNRKMETERELLDLELLIQEEEIFGDNDDERPSMENEVPAILKAVTNDYIQPCPAIKPVTPSNISNEVKALTQLMGEMLSSNSEKMEQMMRRQSAMFKLHNVQIALPFSIQAINQS